MSGDANLEVVLRRTAAETCRREMYLVIPRLAIGMFHLTAFLAHPVAEIPMIRKRRIVTLPVGRKRKRAPRISGGRVNRRHGGRN